MQWRHTLWLNFIVICRGFESPWKHTSGFLERFYYRRGKFYSMWVVPGGSGSSEEENSGGHLRSSLYFLTVDTFVSTYFPLLLLWLPTLLGSILSWGNKLTLSFSFFFFQINPSLRCLWQIFVTVKSRVTSPCLYCTSNALWMEERKRRRQGYGRQNRNPGIWGTWVQTLIEPPLCCEIILLYSENTYYSHWLITNLIGL